MTSKAVVGIAVAAGCALAFGAISPAQAQLFTNGPQVNSGDFNHSLAARNNAGSAQYERLLQANPGFRQARMQRECGPITDPQMRAQCTASFGEPSSMMTGSSMPPSRQRQPWGNGY